MILYVWVKRGRDVRIITDANASRIDDVRARSRTSKARLFFYSFFLSFVLLRVFLSGGFIRICSFLLVFFFFLEYISIIISFNFVHLFWCYSRFFKEIDALSFIQFEFCSLISWSIIVFAFVHLFEHFPENPLTFKPFVSI